MNCPYCDESVHSMSKFCPKCGLPLKEDATVMGAYASDDSGPSMAVLGGGAAALLAITLIIGWVSSRGNKPTQQVQRQPVPTFQASPVAQTAGFNQFNPGFGSGFNSGTPSLNYNPNVKWAYTPPATPAAPAQQLVPMTMPAPSGPEAPPHNITSPVIRPPQAQPTVAIARSITPEIPTAPSVPPPVELGPGEVYIQEPTAEVTELQQLEADGVIAYDPVQEQYVIVPGRRPGDRNRQRGRVVPAPVNPSQ